jgi:hypothetical protein
MWYTSYGLARFEKPPYLPRTTEYKTTAAATLALRDAVLPVIGIFASESHRLRTK